MPILIGDGTDPIVINDPDLDFKLITGALLDTGTSDAFFVTADDATITIDGTVLSEDDGVDGGGNRLLLHVGTNGVVNVGSDGLRTVGTNATVIVEGTVNAVDQGIEMEGTNGTLLNSGYIFSAEEAVEIATTGATVFNSGTIESTNTAFDVNGGNAVITNTGTIIGGSEAMDFSDVAAESSITFFNSGTVESTFGPRAILGSAGRDFIFNTGTLDGNVALGGGNDVFDGRGGTVIGTVYGQGGSDTIYAGAGGGEINGGGGGDRLIGGAGEDILAGASGADVLRGNGGNDDLRGGGGDDLMFGGAGSDFLKGFGDDDIMDGGRGNDNLNGGAGDDTFVFQLNAGDDRIFAWENGADVIDLSAYELGSIFDVSAAITDVGADAVVDLSALGGNGSITIVGQAGNIDAFDFIVNDDLILVLA
ncbi:calcium-binding protein [Algicella marina]|uniref:Calcium-binding protein n=1 Tax=Algicella marina TaxID=2683284 RepID=A0A6P1SWW4_9RHOB|nr:calcium-binding protein [Algicella marina]QHQ35164.1 hypothetical protein GO499_08110 [Algicella marina]